MKRIEDVAPEITLDLTAKIQDFWSRNVNCEKIMGVEQTRSERGTEQYFNDLEKQRYRSHRHLLPWIKGMQPGNSVLEIGCGIGLDSFQMARHGMKLTAVDLTDVAINIVSNRFKNNDLKGRFEVGDATNLQFDDDSFDYVYSFGVLHHARDTEKTIKEVHRVLKPGGEARIMLYNRHSLNEIVHRITGIPFEDKDELCPVVRRFSAKEVEKLFNMFSSVSIHKDFVYGEGYGKLFRFTPIWLYKLLSASMGWHLMISARK